MSDKREGQFQRGNKDGKHYWLTPTDLLEKIKTEFSVDFDPCPFPLPEGFDGLTCEWGKSNYVNPPFGSIVKNGKKYGPTAWAKKAMLERSKGNDVVLVFPVDKWLLMLIQAADEIRNLGDVRWLATEDGSIGPGNGRHIAMIVLKGNKT